MTRNLTSPIPANPIRERLELDALYARREKLVQAIRLLEEYAIEAGSASVAALRVA